MFEMSELAERFSLLDTYCNRSNFEFHLRHPIQRNWNSVRIYRSCGDFFLSSGKEFDNLQL